jgi:RNA polymerase sigma-70 factor (ECF subfamily)
MIKTNTEPTRVTIARARAGEEAALIELYEWYKPRIQRFLYYRTRDRHAAEDLTTEVFLRMLQNLPSFQFQGTPFQAWLFQIARNLVVDDFRKQSVRNHEPIDEALAANQEPPEEIAQGRILRTELQNALLELTDGQLDVITLRFIAGQSIADVAQALEKSESAVKSLQARGLKALEQRLAAREVTNEPSRQ